VKVADFFVQVPVLGPFVHQAREKKKAGYILQSAQENQHCFPKAWLYM
jgi:hypothetical protein